MENDLLDQFDWGPGNLESPQAAQPSALPPTPGQEMPPQEATSVAPQANSDTPVPESGFQGPPAPADKLQKLYQGDDVFEVRTDGVNFYKKDQAGQDVPVTDPDDVARYSSHLERMNKYGTGFDGLQRYILDKFTPSGAGVGEFAGQIAGAEAGAAMGASAGAMLGPAGAGVGAVAGAIGGSVIGGTAMAALGDMLEDALTEDRPGEQRKKLDYTAIAFRSALGGAAGKFVEGMGTLAAKGQLSKIAQADRTITAATDAAKNEATLNAAGIQSTVMQRASNPADEMILGKVSPDAPPGAAGIEQGLDLQQKQLNQFKTFLTETYEKAKPSNDIFASESDRPLDVVMSNIDARRKAQWNMLDSRLDDSAQNFAFNPEKVVDAINQSVAPYFKEIKALSKNGQPITVVTPEGKIDVQALVDLAKKSESGKISGLVSNKQIKNLAEKFQSFIDRSESAKAAGGFIGYTDDAFASLPASKREAARVAQNTFGLKFKELRELTDSFQAVASSLRGVSGAKRSLDSIEASNAYPAWQGAAEALRKLEGDAVELLARESGNPALAAEYAALNAKHSATVESVSSLRRFLRSNQGQNQVLDWVKKKSLSPEDFDKVISLTTKEEQRAMGGEMLRSLFKDALDNNEAINASGILKKYTAIDPKIRSKLLGAKTSATLENTLATIKKTVESRNMSPNVQLQAANGIAKSLESIAKDKLMAQAGEASTTVSVLSWLKNAAKSMIPGSHEALEAQLSRRIDDILVEARAKKLAAEQVIPKIQAAAPARQAAVEAAKAAAIYNDLGERKQTGY